MSWARNIQNRIQQQQQFQHKPQPLQQQQNAPAPAPSPTPSPSVLSTLTTQATATATAAATSPKQSTPTYDAKPTTTTTTTTTITPPTNSSPTSTSPPNSSPSVLKQPSTTVTPPSSTPITSTASNVSSTATSTSTTPVSVPKPATTTPQPTPLSTVQPITKPSASSSSSSSSSASTSSRPMPPLSSNFVPQVKIQEKKLTSDMFKGNDFSTITFVEDLTRKIVNDQMGSDGLHFNPSPFNQLFLNTQLQLSQLESNIDKKMDDLVDECNEYGREYKLKLNQLTDSYQECFQQFKKLEKGVNTIGTKAVHFGDELDSVNQQKNKAQSALSLINYLLELNNSTSTQRSDIFTNSDRIHELANLVKKLSSVSEDLKDISGLNKGKLETESISNTLENDLLNQFERAAERLDFEKMSQCAATLHNFNGGERCRARYIQKMKMFFDIDSLRKDETLANNTSKRIVRGNTIIDTRFEIFFNDILRDVAHEQNVIQNVFINQTSAMGMMITRVFEQRVRMFVERVLALEEKNNLSFLQTLYYAFTNTKKLLVDPLSSYGIVGVDFSQLLSSIYCTYQDIYIQREIQSLTDIYTKQLVEENDRILSMTHAQDLEEDGLNHEITQTFAQQTEYALTRCCSLSPDHTLAENIRSIFFLMLKYLFSDYVESTLDRASDILPVTDSSSLQSITRLFGVVLGINQIVGQIQSLFQLFVLPPIQTSINIQSQCSDQLYFNISNLENKICIALENSMTIMIQLIEKALIDQKKNDYQLEDYDNSVTPTCGVVIKLIHSLFDLCKNCLQGKNFNIFIEELGLKIQLIGQGVGALKLIRDLTEYRNVSKLFKSHKVDEAFEILFEISKLHFVGPENLKSVVEGGALSRMQKSDLIIFLKQRSDFKSNWTDMI
eukprot:gene2100-2588_t